MKVKFLDLGMQPIANKFLSQEEVEAGNEFKFNLNVVFDTETKLVSLGDFVPPEMMFNDSYVYHSSMSQTMRSHFSETALKLNKEFSPRAVLEIGSNDGVFIKHFDKGSTLAIEPCGNFADITNNMGYKTLNKFWDYKSAEEIRKVGGEQDLIFSANCMCHIQNLAGAFYEIKKTLSPIGVFVFEDPSLLKMLDRGSYDQIYDEHAHIFSITALRNILNELDLEVFRVEDISVHGGSHRVYVCHTGMKYVEESVTSKLSKESKKGLNNVSTYIKFAERVDQSKKQLVGLLSELKRRGYKIISYGATSKSTTVFNYCGIDKYLVNYITDTTPAKQGKFSPGTHIPVISPEAGLDGSVDYAFLGAWNFEKEIAEKESEFLKSGAFITHVPYVRFVR